MHKDMTEQQLRAHRRSCARELLRSDQELQSRGLCPCGGTYEDLPKLPPGMALTRTFTSTLLLGGEPSETYYVPPAPMGKRCSTCGTWTEVPSVVCNNAIGVYAQPCGYTTAPGRWCDRMYGHDGDHNANGGR